MSERAMVVLVLQVAFLGVALGGRSVLHRRRTGDWGFRWQREDRIARVSGVLLVGAVVVGLVGTVLVAFADAPLWEVFDHPVIAAIGGACALVGGVLTFVAQVTMGSSWRIGVDPGERTELVVEGPFQRVRHPVFTGMILTALGLALLVPTAVTLGAVLVLVAGVQLQVRGVEEPYLLGTTSGYREYARRVGRFVPLLGRIR